MRFNGRMGQSRDELIDISDALYTSDRRAEGRIVPEEYKLSLGSQN